MISVIVPVYNSGLYLQDCLNSILSQTYKCLEIICVNDGSTDNSQEILADMEQQDSRIKVLTQENAGVSAARNAGLDAATGDYITFVDSDDALEPDMYEILLNLIEKHQADIAHCGYKKIHLDGSTKDVCGTGELLVQDGLEASRCLLTGEHFTGGLWNKIYHSSIVGNIRFDTALKINEDVLFNAKLFQKAETAVFLDVPKYHYFERENSACSRTASIRKKQDAVVAGEQILQLFVNTSVEPAAANRLNYCLIDLYRAYLFDGIQKNRKKCKEIHGRICDIARLCQMESHRNRNNYRLMRMFPRGYKWVYTLYDRIRKPNWDI